MKELSCLLCFNQYGMLLARKKNTKYLIFIGGKIERGESIEEALHREVKEETGCTIKDVSYDSFYTSLTTSGLMRRPIKVHLHKATIIGKPLPQNEIAELVWYNKHYKQYPVAPNFYSRIPGFFQKYM